MSLSPEEMHDLVERTFQRLREAGWVHSYKVVGGIPVTVAWSERGLASLAVLREFDRQLRMTEDNHLCACVVSLAAKFGPNIARNPPGV